MLTAAGNLPVQQRATDSSPAHRGKHPAGQVGFHERLLPHLEQYQAVGHHATISVEGDEGIGTNIDEREGEHLADFLPLEHVVGVIGAADRFLELPDGVDIGGRRRAPQCDIDVRGKGQLRGHGHARREGTRVIGHASP